MVRAKTSIWTMVEGLNNAAFVAVFVVLKLLVSYLFSVLSVKFLARPIMADFPDLGTKVQTFISIVLLGPVVETYLFQQLFFEHLSKYLKKGVIVVVSSVVFGLCHVYNPVYSVYAFFSGLLLSASYCFRINRYPYLITLAIHCIYNLLAFLLNNQSGLYDNP